MKTSSALTAALLTTLAPAFAFAGGPPGDSPEPSTLVLLLMGATPLLLAAGYHLWSTRRKAAHAQPR